MKKLRTHLENSFFIFVKFLVHIFQNISFKEKTFVAFFPLSNLTLISTVNFWAHDDRKFYYSPFK